jgi:hypothetical protein
VFADPDGRFIAGFSQGKTAYWVVDSEGKTLATDVGKGNWYKWDAPKVDFLVKGKQLIDVVVLGWDWKPISLDSFSHFSGSTNEREKSEHSEWLADRVKEGQRLKEAHQRETEEKLRSSTKRVQLWKATVEAALAGDEAGVRKGLQAGVLKEEDWKATDRGDRRRLIHAVAEAGHAEILRLLVENGTPVDAETRSGETPLSFAALHGHAQAVEALLRAGARVDSKEGRWGWTPLMRAAMRGHSDVVRVLLKAGADRHLRDSDGKNARDHTLANGYKELALLLQ